jgi:hypothetical protein
VRSRHDDGVDAPDNLSRVRSRHDDGVDAPAAGGWHHFAMQRVSTTVVALIGPDASRRALEVGKASNVRAVVPDDQQPLERAVAAWADAATTSLTYVVHDADPLRAVVTDWAALYDGTGQRGALETAIADTVTRWRRRTIELPDYYLVLDAESLPATIRHWYLGVLRAAAPARVVPVTGTAAAVERALTRLPAGRWWPDMPDLLDGIDRVVPDAVNLEASTSPS